MIKNRFIRRQLIGTVISNQMDKTIIVMVERLTKHQLYKKYIRRRSKFAAHDSSNICSIGDKVLISESRPISKTKRWRVCSIIDKAV